MHGSFFIRQFRIGSGWRPGRPGLTLSILLLIGLALTIRPAAAAIDVIDQQIGFGSVYRAGDWTPLRVTLANRPGGGKDNQKTFKGSLRARVMDLAGQSVDYVQPVEVPQPSTKQFELPIMLPSTATAISLELLDEDDHRAYPVISFPPQPGGLPFNVGAFQQNQSPFNMMAWPITLELTGANDTPPLASWTASGATRQQVKPEDLPRSFRNYEGVRLLAVSGRLSQALSPEQLKALETWINLGGQLVVVTPRAAAEIKLDPWLTKVLPAEIASAEEMDLGELWPGQMLPKALVTRWGTIKPDATILLDTAKGPVALARRQGLGKVIALALEPSLSYGRPLQDLLDALALGPWREDLRARHYWAAGNVDPSFRNVMILPNVLVVTGLLILFVIVVGPVNLMVLRRRRRLELAWITIPVLSIVFFIAIYGYGRLAKGGAQHYASIDMLHLASGSSRGWLLWNSIQFSPRDRVYQFSTPEGGAIMPLLRLYDNPRQMNNMMTAVASGMMPPGATRTSMLGGGGSSLAQAIAQRAGDYDLRARVPQWQMAFYQGDQSLEIKGAIRGRVTISNDLVKLHLENGTEAELIDATLCVGARNYPLGKIGAGQTVDREIQETQGVIRQAVYNEEVALPGDEPFQQNAYSALRNGAYESYPMDPTYRPQRRCRLIARQTAWKNPVTITPAPQYTKNLGLIEVDLPLSIEGTVTLAMTDMLWREIDQASSPITLNYQGYNQMGGQFGQFAMIQSGNSFELALGAPPLDQPARFERGMIVVRDVPFNEQLLVRAFNCQTGAWELAGDGAEPGKIRQSAQGDNLTDDGFPKPAGNDDQQADSNNQQQSPPGMMPGMMMPGQFPNQQGNAQIVMDRMLITIKPEWVNQVGNFVRLRFESAPAKNPTQGSNGMYGVGINNIGAQMTLTGGAAVSGPRPSTQTADMTAEMNVTTTSTTPNATTASLAAIPQQETQP